MLRKTLLILGKAVAALVALACLILASLLVWLYFYTADLPDVVALKTFAPELPSDVEFSECGRTVRVPVIPYSEMNDRLRAALVAAEGNVRPGVLKSQYLALFSPNKSRGGMYSMQLARDLFCFPQRRLSRTLGEIRAAIQIERRFTPDERVAIFANRMYTGADRNGIEAAAAYYFHKHAKELNTSEAALLVGLIRAPSQLSPIKHPDRALKRRNDVIDGMLTRGAISSEEAEKAKNSRLSLVISET